MKKLIALMLVCAFITGALTACGGHVDSEYSVSEICSKITESAGISDMILMPEDDLESIYGLDLNTYDEYIFAQGSKAPMAAEYIFIVKTSNPDARAQVKAFMTDHIDSCKTLMEGYVPDQYPYAAEAKVTECGNYIYMIMSSKRAELVKAIGGYIK